MLPSPMEKATWIKMVSFLFIREKYWVLLVGFQGGDAEVAGSGGTSSNILSRDFMILF